MAAASFFFFGRKRQSEQPEIPAGRAHNKKSPTIMLSFLLLFK
jgi:hypothetical protein